MKRDTYVERFLQNNPSRFRLNFKVFHILWVVWCGYWVYNGTVIISIFIRRRHTQYVCADACILFHIFDVFLKWMGKMNKLDGICAHTPKEKKICHFHVENVDRWFMMIYTYLTIKQRRLFNEMRAQACDIKWIKYEIWKKFQRNKINYVKRAREKWKMPRGRQRNGGVKIQTRKKHAYVIIDIGNFHCGKKDKFDLLLI